MREGGERRCLGRFAGAIDAERDFARDRIRKTARLGAVLRIGLRRHGGAAHRDKTEDAEREDEDRDHRLDEEETALARCNAPQLNRHGCLPPARPDRKP